MSKALNTYRVLYAATLGEWYEIDAIDADDAEERACTEGRHVDRDGRPCDRGECHDIVPVQVITIADTPMARFEAYLRREGDYHLRSDISVHYRPGLGFWDNYKGEYSRDYATLAAFMADRDWDVPEEFHDVPKGGAA